MPPSCTLFVRPLSTAQNSTITSIGRIHGKAAAIILKDFVLVFWNQVDEENQHQSLGKWPSKQCMCAG